MSRCSNIGAKPGGSQREAAFRAVRQLRTYRRTRLCTRGATTDQFVRGGADPSGNPALYRPSNSESKSCGRIHGGRCRTCA